MHRKNVKNTQKEQSLVVTTSLAEKIGLNEAIVLRQLLYWQEKCGDNEWIYNSYKDWKKQFKFLSVRTIRRAFASLTKQGFLESKRGQRYKFYRLSPNPTNKALLDPDATNNFTDTVGVACSELKVTLYDEDTLKQMLEMWEKKIPSVGQALSLTPQRKSKLQTLLVTTFDRKLEQWQNFVEKIADSEFLMGKVTKFKISINWAIIPENCLKILEGAYSNKNLNSTNIVTQDKLQANIELIQDNNWKETSKLLIKILSPGEYHSWLGRIKFEKYEDNRIYLQAESKFISDWVDGHYSHKIRCAWHEATYTNAVRVIIRSITS